MIKISILELAFLIFLPPLCMFVVLYSVGECETIAAKEITQ